MLINESLNSLRSIVFIGRSASKVTILINNHQLNLHIYLDTPQENFILYSQTASAPELYTIYLVQLYTLYYIQTQSMNSLFNNIIYDY